MKINVLEQLTELDGTPIFVRQDIRNVDLCPECLKKVLQRPEPLTLRRVCTRSLTAITPHTSNLSGQEKFERGQLASVIFLAPEPDLTVEQLALLKKVIGEVEGPLVIFNTYNMLDPPGET